MNFKKWINQEIIYESDIFGFDKHTIEKEKDVKNFDDKPIRQFDTELMMDILSKKTISGIEPYLPFMDEIRWGNKPGSLKIDTDTGYTFYIKQLAVDKIGNPRWITKKMFQLDRSGVGGSEDDIAQRLFNYVEKFSKLNIESPKENFTSLENLTTFIYGEVNRNIKNIFYSEGIKKVNDNAYIMKFGVKGSGLEINQHRIEQNQIMITYDQDNGTIRIINYNLLSPTGGPHEWKTSPSNLEIYFFPTQSKEEIADAVVMHMKHY